MYILVRGIPTKI